MNRVLIVDDDEELGEVLSQTLTRLGYFAVSCGDPYQALNLFQDAPDRFDIVIIDQVMPQTTGTELAKLLLRIKDDVPMILLTGHGDLIPLDQVRQAGFRAALTKPVSKEQIKQAIEKIREGGRREELVS